VVNDGSKDGTGRAVEALIGKVAKLKLLDNHVNHGKGYVVRQGLLAAKGQVRLFTDSDNSTPIEEVEKLLPFLRKDMMWLSVPAMLRERNLSRPSRRSAGFGLGMAYVGQYRSRDMGDKRYSMRFQGNVCQSRCRNSTQMPH